MYNYTDDVEDDDDVPVDLDVSVCCCLLLFCLLIVLFVYSLKNKLREIGPSVSKRNLKN